LDRGCHRDERGDESNLESEAMMRRRWGVVVATLALAASSEVSGQAPGGLKARLDPILKAQHEAKQRYIKAFEGKPTAEAKEQAISRYGAEVTRSTHEVLELVRGNPKDPAVVEALKFVIETARAGPGDESYQAMELLCDHVREPGMGDVCGHLFYFVHVREAESLLRAVMDTHPNRKDRGQACHNLAKYLRMQASMVRRIHQEPARIDKYAHERHKEGLVRFVKDADPDALDKQAEALLERVVAEFADVQRWYDQQPLGPVAEGELFAIRNLSVGKIAPDIKGKDHAGKPLALSDYRGKVVVLTFSGNWCGPCVALYPQERELIAELKDKPFAVVSVNTDANVETLTQSITSGQIIWRCWWDGGTTGPITLRWGVTAFPTIFVLDRAGVIRFKDVRGPELDRAVVSLLEEVPAERSPLPSTPGRERQ
jgi:thiol-disulfide isomerase/thioredoxin